MPIISNYFTHAQLNVETHLKVDVYIIKTRKHSSRMHTTGRYQYWWKRGWRRIALEGVGGGVGGAGDNKEKLSDYLTMPVSPSAMNISPEAAADTLRGLKSRPS